MIIVDPQRQAGIPTDAYMAVQEIKEDGTSASKTFHHIPSSITASEPEEIGVEHLLRDIKDLSTATLSTRMSDLLSSLRGLSSRLYEIREYLNDVESGKLPVNHQVIYHLQDVFNLLPALQGPKGKARTTTTNDGLLVTYLSSLIRAVVALHDLVNNKVRPLFIIKRSIAILTFFAFAWTARDCSSRERGYEGGRNRREEEG